jgi:putative resolvase
MAITDIGSGINWKRKGFQKILELAMLGELEEIVVAHRDRLCRFAFELVEFIFQKNNVRLVVLDRNDYKSGEAKLADDILSIVHVYSCRRNYKTQPCDAEDKTDFDENAA